MTEENPANDENTKGDKGCCAPGWEMGNKSIKNQDAEQIHDVIERIDV